MAGHCISTNHSCKFWTESVGPSVTTTSASLSLNTQIRTTMYYTELLTGFYNLKVTMCLSLQTLALRQTNTYQCCASHYIQDKW
jgi:hypothetical protein